MPASLLVYPKLWAVVLGCVFAINYSFIHFAATFKIHKICILLYRILFLLTMYFFPFFLSFFLSHSKDRRATSLPSKQLRGSLPQGGLPKSSMENVTRKTRKNALECLRALLLRYTTKLDLFVFLMTHRRRISYFGSISATISKILEDCNKINYTFFS